MYRSQIVCVRLFAGVQTYAKGYAYIMRLND